MKIEEKGHMNKGALAQLIVGLGMHTTQVRDLFFREWLRVLYIMSCLVPGSGRGQECLESHYCAIGLITCTVINSACKDDLTDYGGC